MTNRKKTIEEIMDNFQAIKRTMMTGFQHPLHSFRITPAQIQVLFLVKKRGGLGIKEIAGHLGISSSAATQLVDSLVEHSYLIHKESQEDRRAIIITLSPTSKNMIKTIRKISLQRFSTLFDALSDDDLDKLNELSQKIAKRILGKK